jgi:hypothetical protein
MEQLTIQPGNPGSPDARRLIEDLDGYLNSLYPAESNHLLSTAERDFPDCPNQRQTGGMRRICEPW